MNPKRHAAPFALALALFAAGCASVIGPRQVELPLNKLQEAMNRRFPFNSRYLELFDISVSNPRLALQPGANRIVTSLDALVALPFAQKSWSGSVSISGGLHFDPMRNAIMLADPRVENFNINGLDPAYARQIGKTGSLLAEELLKGVPLYTFTTDQMRYGGVRFYPSQIATTPNSLVVTFEPMR